LRERRSRSKCGNSGDKHHDPRSVVEHNPLRKSFR
jgi:hypothetical protein